jgi:hypothetical protein
MGCERYFSGIHWPKFDSANSPLMQECMELDLTHHMSSCMVLGCRILFMARDMRFSQQSFRVFFMTPCRLVSGL